MNRRSIYTRYVDPTVVRQPPGDSNRQLMLPPPPATSTPVLQTNQSNNPETPASTNKLEESGGAKHIDPKLIEMITSEVGENFTSLRLSWQWRVYLDHGT